MVPSSHWVSATSLSLLAERWLYRHRNAQWRFVLVAASLVPAGKVLHKGRSPASGWNQNCNQHRHVSVAAPALRGGACAAESANE
jgi:hypothetical protein